MNSVSDTVKRAVQMMISMVGMALSVVGLVFGCQTIENNPWTSETVVAQAPEEGGEKVEEDEPETGKSDLADYEQGTLDDEKLPAIAEAAVLIGPETAQEAVDIWLSSYRHGNVGVEVFDVNSGMVIASYQANVQMRPRSLYKLFYYYDAYAEVTAGHDDLSQEYEDGKTLGGCLDAIIRSSNNPCAEKMYNDSVRAARVAQLIQRLGLAGTRADGLMTTAHDVSTLLQYYYAHPEWSEEVWARFRESALNQPYAYRKGLPSGFTMAAVYNKVGFGTDEAGVSVYNDAAMVETAGGGRYIVVVMTTQTDYMTIRALGALLEQVMV